MPPVLALGRTNGAMRADTAHAHRTPLSPVRSRRCGVAALRRCGVAALRRCGVAAIVVSRPSCRSIAHRRAPSRAGFRDRTSAARRLSPSDRALVPHDIRQRSMRRR
ncbi:hypothetical protein WS83_07275 [Burkholderia sp. MSMB2042]|nr:hypothetical protein WS78_23690 [Burkholderia savannae]KVG38209.1 hypothetical protein WS77_21235 [Burkholderia sp. MSMB0265]KVG91809.1 hypothetical protein WS82_13490 [Burkholderia sp. MSMB2041]KVG94315.1 hypothetical protein WS83_07275 [Burkholderia sp. MSMB2042]